ncbi:hypothetical protein BY457_12919 [Marinilabilia salmonicolor]|jgi:hypothetical protein|nr:hypothetical protein BY457_12919 [Marinilabilia salmonicolor]
MDSSVHKVPLAALHLALSDQTHDYKLSVFHVFELACSIHKSSIMMLNYLRNMDVLNKNNLKIVHYFLHHFYLRESIFLDI